MLNAMLIQLYQPLNFMGMLYREVKQAIIDIDMMFDILDQPNEIAEAPDALALIVTAAPCVSRTCISLTIRRARSCAASISGPAGKTLAIVGASGAGKSTISRLIFRFSIHSGAASDRRPGHREGLAGLAARCLGMAPQDNVLFNDTIRYNILYGRPDAGEEANARGGGAGADRAISSKARPAA